MKSTRSSQKPPSQRIKQAAQTRGEDTRKAILEAAIQCFCRHGVASTNTTMISERAGVSRGAYLHHFKSREMLIAATINFTQQQAMHAIDDGIRQLFLNPSNELFEEIWQKALPDSFLAGYEMMLMARFNEELRSEWLFHSRQFKERRIAILNTLFDAHTVETEALPVLEAIADFFRGVKIMEVVRTREESLAVIRGIAPVFSAQLISLQSKLLELEPTAQPQSAGRTGS